jgi:hypothetical protein
VRDLRPTVRVGQVWASNHRRDREDGKRQCRLVVGIDALAAELLTPGERTSTRVQLHRSGIKGYRLVEEAPDGAEETESA